MLRTPRFHVASKDYEAIVTLGGRAFMPMSIVRLSSYATSYVPQSWTFGRLLRLFDAKSFFGRRRVPGFALHSHHRQQIRRSENVRSIRRESRRLSRRLFMAPQALVYGRACPQRYRSYRPCCPTIVGPLHSSSNPVRSTRMSP